MTNDDRRSHGLRRQPVDRRSPTSRANRPTSSPGHTTCAELARLDRGSVRAAPRSIVDPRRRSASVASSRTSTRPRATRRAGRPSMSGRGRPSACGDAASPPRWPCTAATAARAHDVAAAPPCRCQRPPRRPDGSGPTEPVDSAYPRPRRRGERGRSCRGRTRPVARAQSGRAWTLRRRPRLGRTTVQPRRPTRDPAGRRAGASTASAASWRRSTSSVCSRTSSMPRSRGQVAVRCRRRRHPAPRPRGRRPCSPCELDRCVTCTRHRAAGDDVAAMHGCSPRRAGGAPFA